MGPHHLDVLAARRDTARGISNNCIIWRSSWRYCNSVLRLGPVSILLRTVFDQVVQSPNIKHGCVRLVAASTVGAPRRQRSLHQAWDCSRTGASRTQLAGPLPLTPSKYDSGRCQQGPPDRQPPHVRLVVDSSRGHARRSQTADGDYNWHSGRRAAVAIRSARRPKRC